MMDSNQNNIPQTAQERQNLARKVRSYFADSPPVPPLSPEELEEHALGLLSPVNKQYTNYVKILINNLAWETIVASVPFSRRTLLLPPCMRNSTECKGEFDELGLLCENCGNCSIDQLTKEAETLGYAVLVAEGNSIVKQLIKSGAIDAVIGVSCMASLEKAFPEMAADAVPGLALPLRHDGCKDTETDSKELLRIIHLRSDKEPVLKLNLSELENTVNQWFQPNIINPLINLNNTAAECIAADWLCRDGKRSRPLLTAAVYQALTGSAAIPKSIQQAAIAVECFHKASLIHDDIEDNDATRYGQPALHIEKGIPQALNAGDLLIGEGYRLLAEADLPLAQKSAILHCAALAHRELCCGQGDELAVTPVIGTPPATECILEIFRRKTAPAFSVALHIGALAADTDQTTITILETFSQIIGVGYQIHDDLSDYRSETNSDLHSNRPSLIRSLDSESTAETLLKDYRKQALDSLRPIQQTELKILLTRLTNKILPG